MSICVTFYRLPTSELRRVTHDQPAWEAFRAEIQGAYFAALRKAMTGPDEFVGTPEERFARLDASLLQQRDPRRFDLEKDWQTVAYLLTGREDIVEQHDDRDLLYSAIFGGHETGVETGYGPVRFYDVQLVSDTAAALQSADPRVIARRFDPEHMSEVDIYAAPDESERDEVLAVLGGFSTFFATTAKLGEGIIKFAT